MEPYPTGARDSFIITLFLAVVALIFKLWSIHKKENDSVKAEVSTWITEDIFVKGGLLIITFVAVWIAVRGIGYTLRLLFFEEETLYTVFYVLDIITYVLAINLCITLLKSTEVSQIASATMQSVLLAILIFLPRATSKAAKDVFGLYGSALILIGLAALLVSLVYAIRFSTEKKQEKT